VKNHVNTKNRAGPSQKEHLNWSKHLRLNKTKKPSRGLGRKQPEDLWLDHDQHERSVLQIDFMRVDWQKRRR